jgi:cation diffusion facilitator CzcD-associated flavoprotein CzcO
MPVKMGREAVVIGAGMGGLTAASALSAHFDHVTVLERDALPAQPEARAGTPQSRHPHVLLLSGQLYGTNVGVER